MKRAKFGRNGNKKVYSEAQRLEDETLSKKRSANAFQKKFAMAVFAQAAVLMEQAKTDLGRYEFMSLKSIPE